MMSGDLICSVSRPVARYQLASNVKCQEVLSVVSEDVVGGPRGNYNK